MAFLAGLVLAWGAAGALADRVYRDPAAEKYATLFAGGFPPAAQLWGTSHVLHGVSPCLLGDDVSNMAYSAATPTFYRAWYADWRRSNPAPRRVYLGLDSSVFTRFPWSRRYEQDSAYWPWPAFLARATAGSPEAATIWQNRVPLVRHRDALQWAVVGGQDDRYRLLWDQACRGFVPLAPRPAGPAPSTRRAAAAAPPAAPAPPADPAFAADLPALLEALRRDEVAVVAFQPPYGPASRRAAEAPNARLAALLAARRIPFLNYNAREDAEFHARPALYVDASHLNAAGAERFSRRLAHDLRARAAL